MAVVPVTPEDDAADAGRDVASEFVPWPAGGDMAATGEGSPEGAEPAAVDGSAGGDGGVMDQGGHGPRSGSAPTGAGSDGAVRPEDAGSGAAADGAVLPEGRAGEVEGAPSGGAPRGVEAPDTWPRVGAPDDHGGHASDGSAGAAAGDARAGGDAPASGPGVASTSAPGTAGSDEEGGPAPAPVPSAVGADMQPPAVPPSLVPAGGGAVIDQSVPGGPPSADADAAEAVPQWLEAVQVPGLALARFVLPGAHGGVVAAEDGGRGALSALVAGASYDLVATAFRVRLRGLLTAARVACVLCACLARGPVLFARLDTLQWP